MRSLLKRPGFLLVAVVTLGLGIGANTAIFSVVNAVLLRPLPYPGGDRIVRIIQNRPPAGQPGGLPPRLAAITTDDLQAWRTRTATFSEMAGYGPASLTLTGRDEPVRLAGARVSPAMFPLLGVAPFIGRAFDATEEKPGADAVAMLSFTAWQKYFAGDPDILRRTVMLDGKGYAVVGVMPQGFEFPDRQTEIWVPFTLTPSVITPGQRMIQIIQVIARVKNDVPLERASAEANVIFRQLREDETRSEAGLFGRGGPPADGPLVIRRGGPPADGPQMVQRGDVPMARRGGPDEGAPMRGGLFGPPAAVTIELAPLKDELVRPVRQALLVLLVAVGFVLLIACANVANLLLARASDRQQEMAVRTALGATRARIAQQVLTESLILAVMGSGVGVAIAWAGVETLRLVGPSDIPRLADIQIDAPMFLFTLAVSVITGAVFGAAPAVRLSRSSEMQTIKSGIAAAGSGLNVFGRHRTRGVLAIAEIGLAMVLLVGAGLLINSFRTLSNVNPGYDPRNVLAFQVALPESRYSGPQRSQFYQTLLERLSPLPDVTAAAISSTLPLQQGITRISVTLEGRPEPTRLEETPIADVRVVSADYVKTMGIALVDGRQLNRNAGDGQPLEVLVNESFARRYFSGDRAVGARMNLDGPASWEIVGVVSDVRHAGLTAEPVPELYVDYRQVAAVMPRGLRDAFFTVRTAHDPSTLVSAIRGIVRQIDGDLVVENVATMEQRLAVSVARPRFYATLVGVFAAIALVLAAVGVYGVLSYAVSQCTREIGIRIALGASRSGVLGLVLRQGLAIAAAGLLLGLAGAAMLTRSLTSLLFGMSPFDPLTFGAAAGVLTMVALVACVVPAWRATGVDPIQALRQQ
jgi:predicted permease